MSKPRFKDFEYRGQAEPTDVAAIAKERRVFYSPTGTSNDEIEQTLATYVVTPRILRDDTLIVRTTAFSDDNGRTSGALFDSLLATETGRRVIAANAPGVDFYQYAASAQTPEQIEDLRSGNFRKVGGAVMNALHDVAKSGFDIDDPHFIITASSMGSAIAAGMLGEARERDIKIAGVTLAETVNVDTRSLAKLGMNFMNQPTVGGYLEQNPQSLRDLDEPVIEWIKRVRHDFAANLRYAKAMAHGAFMTDLGAIDHLENVPIFVSRGGGSQLSTPSAFETMQKKFAKVADLDSHVFGDPVDNPHDHPYTMTVQSVIDALDKVS